MKAFDEVLKSADGTYQVSDDWLQGRTTFGGLAAAIGLQEIQKLAQPGRVPLSLNVEFIAPIPPVDITACATVLRSGKYLDHIEAELSVDGSVAVGLQAVLGAPIDTEFETIPQAEPLNASLTDARNFSRKSEHYPPFLEHFDFKYTESGFPFSGRGTGVIGGFCKHQGSADGYTGLVALLDAWPPTALPFYTRPVAASSVHWNIHFHSHKIDSLDFGQSYYEYIAKTFAAEQGMATTQATLSKEKEVLVSARQLVAIFD